MEENKQLIPQFLLSAAASGVGKTTVSIGLMRLLSDRGLKISSFKCGPDYIDTCFHRLATGFPSINLDSFMGSERHIKSLYSSKTIGKDVAIVEGAMGMFDGYDKCKGSAAHIARIIGIPVVLIINGASTAYSAAPLIRGFKDFDKGVNIGGVIFNNVSSESHFKRLKEACDDIGVVCFGYLKKNKNLEMPSRHLGLRIGDDARIEEFIKRSAQAVADGVDVELLLGSLRRPWAEMKPKTVKLGKQPKLVIAVAKDEAFSFVYQANIDALAYDTDYDVEIKFFSPLHDDRMPRCDLLYLPGGYPELYAGELSANTTMTESIKLFCDTDGKVFAECGGMIYLSQGIDNFTFCGVLPFKSTMHGARLHLGYRNVALGGLTFKGHEFHYSSLVEPIGMASVADQTSARGQAVDTMMFRKGNVFAGYTHFYWGENPKDILKLWNL